MLGAETLSRYEHLHAQLPGESLFAQKEWLLGPEPFALDSKFATELERLGHRLFLFQRACNLLYQRSVQGKQPAWIAEYLDAGKPPELVQLARSRPLRDQVSRIIRPDILLTDDGYAIAELDSIPGGIGLTAWLNQAYAALGDKPIGGGEGMLDGFEAILPNRSKGTDGSSEMYGADILVSQESATYLPEMQWVAEKLNARSGEPHYAVHPAEGWTPGVRPCYRFFEMFDLPNISGARDLVSAASDGRLQMTPPPKPYLEEKLWFALFWMRPLREFWRRELTERHWLELQKVIPYTWILDPAPLPHHAVLPGLEIQSWEELLRFTQKERDLLVKVSGFSAQAWGSRGVTLGSDVPHSDWEQTVRQALDHFPQGPHILQRFRKPRRIQHNHFDRDSQTLVSMQGRVRLCPYYFIEEERAVLRGVLATICPADKKLIHGMSDAVLAPCSVRAEST